MAFPVILALCVHLVKPKSWSSALWLAEQVHVGPGWIFQYCLVCVVGWLVTGEVHLLNNKMVNFLGSFLNHGDDIQRRGGEGSI